MAQTRSHAKNFMNNIQTFIKNIFQIFILFIKNLINHIQLYDKDNEKKEVEEVCQNILNHTSVRSEIIQYTSQHDEEYRSACKKNL
jgi:hypothetical protein